jgi:hypothetical protein
MYALRIAGLSWLAVAAVGCGSSRPQAEIDRGRQAVVAVLDNWKTNEPPAKLKTLPDPVSFTEELRATHKLTDYTVLKADGTDPEVIRVTVNLKLQDKKGKTSEREAVYSVALKSPVVVARDPYF